MKEFKTTLKIGGNEITAIVPYARQGGTVFVLPVWHVKAIRRKLDGKPAVPLRPSDLVYDADAGGNQTLELEIVDLLQDEAVEQLIRAAVKKRINSGSDDPVKLTFGEPIIRRDYRFHLTGSGGGSLPPEVTLTKEDGLPPSGIVRLTLDPAAVKAVEKVNESTLKLAETRLRATGTMRVRFEQTQAVAQIDYLRLALTDLRKRVSSLKDSSGGTPEAFAEIPNGGSAESANVISTLAKQSLDVTVAVRSGADAAPMMDLIRRELDGLVRREMRSITDENKRLAFLMENQVAITATTGEIKKLAKMTEKEREDKFKSLAEDYAKRRKAGSTDVRGSVESSASASFGFARLGSASLSGKVEGGYKGTSDEATEDNIKRETDTLKKGYDKLMKEFDGKAPTVSGIRFDDASLASSTDEVSKRFETLKMTTGDALHRWPAVSLSGQAETGLSGEELLRAYAVTKADLEATRRLLGTPRDLAAARASLARVEKMLEDVDSKSKLLEDALAKVDSSALAKIRKEREEVKENGTSRVVVGKEPPRLDCTGEEGASPKEVRGRQIAWAKYLGEKSHEKTVTLKGDVKMERVLIPPGKFYRGEGDSAKVITITKPMWVGKYEVTQAQYEAVMGVNPSKFKKTGDDAAKYPVETVNHTDAAKFCDAAGKLLKLEGRLPREAEWEYAYRAGTRTKWYSGDDADDVGKIASMGRKFAEGTAEIGTKNANAFGLYDMAGGVWEWCSDWHAAYDATTEDPMGPGDGSHRVVRGGSWNISAEDCSAANRLRNTPTNQSSSLGLRLALVSAR